MADVANKRGPDRHDRPSVPPVSDKTPGASSGPSSAAPLRLIALALATGDQRDDLGGSIPQDVWDALHAEGLVETRRDIVDDAYTNTTRAGLRVLLDAIDAIDAEAAR